MRIGLHSGPVTAGVLRGEKSRFQLFGDTVSILVMGQVECFFIMIQIVFMVFFSFVGKYLRSYGK
jgi:hypothetical protein